jgi:hypothetical protein
MSMRSFKPGAVSIDPIAQRRRRHRATPIASTTISLKRAATADRTAPCLAERLI